MKRLIFFLAVSCLLASISFAQQPTDNPQSAQTASAPAQPANAPAQAASSATPATSSDKATVYFYRYKQYVGSALAPSVFCDEAQLARMENGRYFAVKLEPGKHAFRSNDKQSGAEIDLKAGQEYFFRVEIASGFMKGHGRLIMMVPEQARYELKAKNLTPLDADKIVDKTRVSIDPLQTAEEEKPKDEPTTK
jgi:hypothetical protein